MAASVPVHGCGGVEDRRPHVPRWDGIRAGVASAERPRSGRRRHARHHGGRPVAPRGPALPTGAPPGRRHQLRRGGGPPPPWKRGGGGGRPGGGPPVISHGPPPRGTTGPTAAPPTAQKRAPP